MTSRFSFSTDTTTVDRDRVHHWLSEQSYWAKGRARAMQDAAIDASRNYTIRDGDGTQVAYARVVTDGVTFAWLCDVFVDEGERAQGIGKMLVEGVIDDLMRSTTVYRILLATSTAAGLYAQYGFEPAEEPGFYMAKQLRR